MLAKKRITFILFAMTLILASTTVFADDDVSSFIILNDIPPYYRLTRTRDIVTDKPKTIPGYTSNRLSGALQGVDQYLIELPVTYETTYQSDTLNMGMSVQVTKFVSSDSDKWLVHELDILFRNEFGIPSPSYAPRLVNGQTIMEIAIAGRNYRWLSGNTIIEIEYHDSQLTSREPMEVVQVYLLKYPSTLPSLTLQELRSEANKSAWIKDEMDRRLWLSDKWMNQLLLGKIPQDIGSEQFIRSLFVFLRYREKYFSIKATDEKNVVDSYRNARNYTGLKAKLDEYNKWWGLNRGKAIKF